MVHSILGKDEIADSSSAAGSIPEIAHQAERSLDKAEVDCSSQSLGTKSCVIPTFQHKLIVLAHTPDSRKRAFARITARRVQWFVENGPCKLCGSTNRLEIHHRNPEDKVSHRIWSLCDARRSAELSKCDVLCWSCHHKVVHTSTVPHGASKYDHGCRCEICRAGSRDRIYQWRLRSWGTIASKPRNTHSAGK